MSYINRVYGSGYPGFDPASDRNLDANIATVRLGERRWWQVAQRLGVSEKDLRDANPNLNQNDVLSPGQQINVPVAAVQEEEMVDRIAAQIEPQIEREIRSEIREELRTRHRGVTQFPESDSVMTPFGPSRLPHRYQLSPLPPDNMGAEWSSNSTAYAAAEASAMASGMWTQDMLTRPFSGEVLQGMADPSAFLQARFDVLNQSTSARVVNMSDGSAQSLNAAQMSTLEQAQALAAHLRTLGISGDVVEIRPGGGPFSVDYGDDPRRHWHIGHRNVGLLLQRYAQYPMEMADQMTLAERADQMSADSGVNL